MSYKYTEKERQRGVSRRGYFRDRQRRIRMTQVTDYSRSGNATGRLGEDLFLDKIPLASWVGRPHDGRCLFGRVDIKTSKPTNHRGGRREWKFNLSQKGKLDNFLLFCLEEDSSLVKILCIPDKEETARNISILLDVPSKYDKYVIDLK